MSSVEVLAAIQQELAGLESISFVAHRDAQTALVEVQPVAGGSVALEWLRACRVLFEHDRDAGKAFIRGSAEAARACAGVADWTQSALQFIAWRGSWRAVDGFMTQLPAACRLLGEADSKRWVQWGLEWCARHLESGIAWFQCPVAEFSGGHGLAGIEQVALPSVELFEKRRLALGTYLRGAIRVRDLSGAAAVLPWAKRGADILQAGRLRGEAYFRLESEESLALLMENLPGFRLSEHHRLFQLILRAWFGSGFDLYDSDWSPGKGRAWVETDGVALYVPLVMPERGTAMLSVMHAAGHLVFHSYERRYIEALFRAAGREHPPLDAEQRITWRPLFAAYGEDMIRFQLLFDLCEDTRVDARIAAQVPGYLRGLQAAAEGVEVPTGAAGEYIEWGRALLRWQARGGSGDERFDALRPLLDTSATIVDAFRIANVLYARPDLPPITLAGRELAILPWRAPNAARPVYPRNTLDEAAEKHEAETPDGEVSATDLREKQQTTTIPQQAAGEDPDMEIPPEDTAGSGGRVGVGLAQPAHVQGTGRGPEYSEKGTPYPEWDYRDNRYKMHWAWVQEKVLGEHDAAAAASLLAAHAQVLQRLKRAIQAQKPQRMAPRRRQFEGEELDWDATVEWVVEKRRGTSPSAAIYRQRRMQTRDTAVILLADLSTSIMQQCAEGGRVVDRIRAAMLLFAESMEAVGDPYAVAGFASKYRDNVSYYPIKSFDGVLGMRERAVLGGLSGRLATRMGAAIRHAVAQFDSVASARRLLLILSDGRPADYDDGGDERYLQEDTRMAVKEAIDAGVHPFCITLDEAGSEYLPQIFGSGHYLVIRHMNELPKKLPEVYFRLRR